MGQDAGNSWGALKVHLLGGFRVTVGTRQVDGAVWRLRKSSHLVKLLCLAPGHRLHREQMMDLLWPDLKPGAAANQLRKALHAARRAIDPSHDAPSRFLAFTGESLSLAPDTWVDVDAFQAGADEARRSKDSAAYQAAVALYGGDLLPEDRYEDWALRRSEELHTEYVSLLIELANVLGATTDLDGAVAAMERAAAADPANEAIHRQLMQLYALTGRRQDALRQYARLKEILRQEVGAEPDGATQRLYEEIRTGEGKDPAMRAEVWERVGDLRLVSGDVLGAAAAFEGALGAVASDADVARASVLHRKAAQGFLMGQNAVAAEPHVSAAARLQARVGDELESGRIRGLEATLAWQQGRIEDAEGAARESLEVVERLGEPTDVAAARETLGIVFHFKGAWREGLIEELQRSSLLRLPSAAPGEAESGWLGRVFDLHHCIGQYHLYGDGLSDSVEAYARQALDIAVKKDAKRAQAFAWCLLGESLLLRGRWDEAAGCLERSGQLHADFGISSGALAWQRLAELSACRGDSATAQEYLRKGMAIAVISPMAPHLWGRLYASAALDAVEAGDPAAAVAAVRAASRAAARYGDCPTCSALLHPVAAEAYALMGDAEKAAWHAADAQSVAGYFTSSAWRAMAETASGSAAQASGYPEAASRFLAGAASFEQAGQPYWAARAKLQAAMTMQDSALEAEAGSALEELGARRTARGMFALTR